MTRISTPQLASTSSYSDGNRRSPINNTGALASCQRGYRDPTPLVASNKSILVIAVSAAVTSVTSTSLPLPVPVTGIATIPPNRIRRTAGLMARLPLPVVFQPINPAPGHARIANRSPPARVVDPQILPG